jgi:ABC-type transport system involved in cytochrome c biogenesis permease subunit
VTVEFTLPAWAGNPALLGWLACSLVVLVAAVVLVRKYESPEDDFERVMAGFGVLFASACGPITAALAALVGLFWLVGRLTVGRR